MEQSRKLIFFCSGSDCKKSGSKSLQKDFEEQCKDARWRGKLKLIKTRCLDMCKTAPVVIVENQFCKKASILKIFDAIKKLDPPEVLL
jgi:NADH:ubiquinone oxidoreductase subunit E